MNCVLERSFCGLDHVVFRDTPVRVVGRDGDLVVVLASFVWGRSGLDRGVEVRVPADHLRFMGVDPSSFGA